jgi:hypothetical protein
MTKTDTNERTWCYFIFKVPVGGKYDHRCPDCGLCIAAVTELEAVAKAYQAANNLLQPTATSWSSAIRFATSSGAARR